MKTVTAAVEGISPYSQSRSYDDALMQGESREDHERRTWRGRLHVGKDGIVFIPPMAIKNALSDTAKFLSISVPGRGKTTYTKHFQAGVLAVDPAPLGIRAEDVECERLFVPSDGRPGGGKRVHKYFPIIHPGWKATFVFLILDETVLQTRKEDGRTVFQYVLEEAGKIVGIGRFRPRNNGFYGRFSVTDFAVVDG